MEAKKKRTKNILFACAVALFALGVALLPTILSSQQEEPVDTASYLSTQVQKQDIRSTISGWGTLTEEEGVAVSVPRGVEVTGYLVENGQMVEEGQPLASVDQVSVMQTIATVQENLEYLEKQLKNAPNNVGNDQITSPVAGRVKTVYVQTGDDVTEVLAAHGALAVVSLDGLMALKLETAEPLRAGDAVTVALPDGTDRPGRVEMVQDGVATVTVTDNGPRPGDTARVLAADGTELGSGELYIHRAWNITAVSGVVTQVYAKEENTVNVGARLFALGSVDFSARFRQLSSLHRAYEDTMLRLFDLYQNGTVAAPAAGCVSGVNTARVGLMSNTGELPYRLVLLSNAGEDPAPETEPKPSNPDEAVPEKYINRYARVSEITYGSISFRVQKDASTVTAYTDLPQVDESNTRKSRRTVFNGIQIFLWDMDAEAWKVGHPGDLAVDDLLWFVYENEEADKPIWIIRPDQTVNEPPSGGFGGGYGGGYEEPFEMYERTETQLMQVIPQDKMSVSVTIDEMDILAVAIGQEAEVTVDALPGRFYTGTVTEINPQGQTSEYSWARGNSKYDITIVIDRDENMLKGMNATAILTVGVTEDVLTLPVEALSQKGSQTIVYTGYDPETRTLLDPVNVTVGLSDGSTAQILDGLSEGDTVWYAYYESDGAPTFSGGSQSGAIVQAFDQPLPMAPT